MAEVLKLTPERPQPVSNVEAEQALLAAIMVSNAAYDAVSDFLIPGHFAEPVHGRIYAACGQLIAGGRNANPVSLAHYFEHDGALQEIGGSKYLARVAASVVTIINSADYGHTILDLWRRRQLIAALTDAAEETARPTVERDAGAIVEGLETTLYEIMETRTRGRGLRPVRDVVQEAMGATERAYRAGGKMTGITTGLTDLDKKTGGLQSQELVIVGARPSMGKSSLTANMVDAAARAFLAEAAGKKPKVCAVFSLEMSDRSLGQVLMARRSGISAARQRRGLMGLGDFDRLVETAGEYGRLPIFIDASPGISAGYIRSQVRRLARRNRIGLVAVDYLQLMRAESKGENRRLDLGEFTMGLKGLAKDMDCPVVVLSQLSRAVEARDDKRPLLSDLRESGDIEQDADVVIFIFREEYYLSRSEPQHRTEETREAFSRRSFAWSERLAQVRQKADLIVAKQRLDAIGSVTVRYDAERSAFEDLYAGGNEDGAI